MASVDVERLFRQFTINEVKDVEKKLKSDVEKKKEDLRQMVGRRYQDIIEAADSISDMRQSSEKILNSLHCVQKSLSQLEALQNQLKNSRYKSSMSRFDTSQTDVVFLSKFLNDLAGLIWDALDKKQCLDAAYLHNLANFVHRTILVQNGPNFDAGFVESSWEIIVDQIVEIEQAITDTLKGGVNQNEYDVEMDALCAMLILKNLGLSGALDCYLSGKESTLKLMCNNKKISGRLQICNLLHYLQTTIYSLAKLLEFDIPNVEHRDKGLNVKIQDLNDGLFQCDFLTDYFKVQSTRIMASLPQEIKEFRCRIDLGSIDHQIAKKTLNEWLSRCVKLCCEMISECVPYFASIEALGALKNSVEEILIQHYDSASWISACDKLFGKKVDLWNMLITEFLEKQLVVYCRSVASFQDLAIKQLDDNLARFQNRTQTYFSTNESAFVGSSSNFLFCNQTIVPCQSSVDQTLDLRLKSLGIPMDVYQYVKMLNDDLEGLNKKIQDFYCFSVDERQDKQDVPKFHMNSAKLYKILALQLSSQILKFLDKITIESVALNFPTYCINRYIFVAKICACLADLCPAVKNMLIAENCDQIGFAAITDRLKTVIFQSYSTAIHEKIDELSNVHVPIDDFLPNAEFWLKNSLDWNSLEINDELDDGRKISSTVLVPMSISPYLSGMLNDFCAFLCTIGPNAVPRECILKANVALFARLVRFYDGLTKFLAPDVDAKIGNGFFGQKQAIQCIFELKFLDLLLDKKDPPLEKNDFHRELVNFEIQLSRLITKIESIIDPFDLDSIYPHLRQNVIKLVQKYQAVYGVLLTQESASLQARAFSALKNEANSQENVNTLDPWQIFKFSDETSSSHGRFRLLPVYDDLDRRQIQDVTNLSGISRKSGDLKKSTSFTQPVGQFPTFDVPKIGTIPSLTSIYGKFSSSLFGHKDE